MEIGSAAAPAYCQDVETGEAIGVFAGLKRRLGKWRSRESIVLYAQFLFGWADCSPDKLTVSGLCGAYRQHARERYQRPDGKIATEIRDIALSIRELEDLFGPTLAADFSLPALVTVRRAMIQEGISRRVINQRLRRLRRMFKWAAVQELVPAAIFERLSLMEGLRYGEGGVKEHPPRRPVLRRFVKKTLRFLSPVVQAMVALQLLTGMRPGEIVSMRRREIVETRDGLSYIPEFHKTTWLGEEKEIPLGPRAKALLRPFMKRPPEAFVFSAADSKAWWVEKWRRKDRPPLKRRRVAPEAAKRPARDHFDTHSYGQAIAKACKKAGVPHWTANQIRHLFATELEEEKGIEAVSAMLFHHHVRTSEVYSKARKVIARKLARRRG